MKPLNSVFLAALSLLTCHPVVAQLDPAGVQVISYFPHLTDGGPASQRWTTTLSFVNPHASLPLSGRVSIYGDNGKPLALDFGNGPASQFDFQLPPQGAASFRTRGTAPSNLQGWVNVFSSLPVQAVALISFASNGVPQQGVSALATPASPVFRSPASRTTGIAVANIYADASVPIDIQALGQSGTRLASTRITVPPLGHTAFTVPQMFPSLPSDFQGSVLLTAGNPSETFVSWSVSGEAGVLSGNPPSGLNWPISHHERIWKTWMKLLNAAFEMKMVGAGSIPTLVVDYSTGQINSYAVPTAGEVHIFVNLAELISDSESELAFVIGHELAHIIQARSQPSLLFYPKNLEWDADVYGVLLALVAGYDPYGAAGALAKLAMASGQAGLLAQQFDDLSANQGVDLHGSFNTRIDLIFSALQLACTTPQARTACQLYKTAFHPHLPGNVPLLRSGASME